MHIIICIVVRIVAGLDFARMQRVFQHRIKTANIMYELDSDTVKITGFGIVRITNSSKTETGMVRGTPSCLSPGRLAGKKADALTSLFSLGVMLYQELSCSRRFKADSMTSSIFKIGNEEKAGIGSACTDIPGGLAIVINRTLPGNVEQRCWRSAGGASGVKVFLLPRS